MGLGFWLIAVLLAVVTAGGMLWALLRERTGDAPTAAFDLKVYQDQLKEVEKDLARGVISPEDAERTRLEISRRVLEADRALQTAGPQTSTPKAATWGAGVAALVLVMGGTLALYDRIGAPGYPDLPLQLRKDAADEARAERPRQADAEAQAAQTQAPASPDPRHVDLVEKLRAVVAERPGDVRGLSLLARNEAALGNFKPAYIAQSKLIALKGDNATAGDFSILADMMVLAAGGFVSPEAEAAIDQALTKDPKDGTALYYAGLMYAQTGRPDIAFRIWRDLLDDSSPDDPWVPAVRGLIGDLAMRAGVDYTLPPEPGLAGPGAEDMANAAQMTPEERQDMIRGMVEQLSGRLEAEGGTAAEWARLIGAYGVLGETENAEAARQKARAAFADSAADLAVIDGAGQSAPAAAPALRGPTAEDMENAADMAPEDRQQMIRTMVQNLNDRLATEGGTAAEWAQLIGALGILGEAERAAAIWGEAQTVFAGRDADLARLRDAAETAGVAN